MKLPVLSSSETIAILRKAGFVYAPKRGKGSHIALYRRDTDKTNLVIIPKKKEIPKGTLIAIIEQAGLSREEFLKLM
jgi:predicted RNA binding protein YcfA (HicA-like mRNA interferase family)